MYAINSDQTLFSNILTFARSLGSCRKPRPSASVFNISLGIWQTLMHGKPCLIPILIIPDKFWQLIELSTIIKNVLTLSSSRECHLGRAISKFKSTAGILIQQAVAFYISCMTNIFVYCFPLYVP